MFTLPELITLDILCQREEPHVAPYSNEIKDKGVEGAYLAGLEATW